MESVENCEGYDVILKEEMESRARISARKRLDEMKYSGQWDAAFEYDITGILIGYNPNDHLEGWDG